VARKDEVLLAYDFAGAEMVALISGWKSLSNARWVKPDGTIVRFVRSPDSLIGLEQPIVHLGPLADYRSDYLEIKRVIATCGGVVVQH
jgi:hypothetical protein